MLFRSERGNLPSAAVIAGLLVMDQTVATLLTSVADYQQMDKDRRFGREVWKPLLWAVLALCFSELFLVQWYGRGKK